MINTNQINKSPDFNTSQFYSNILKMLPIAYVFILLYIFRDRHCSMEFVRIWLFTSCPQSCNIFQSIFEVLLEEKQTRKIKRWRLRL